MSYSGFKHKQTFRSAALRLTDHLVTTFHYRPCKINDTDWLTILLLIQSYEVLDTTSCIQCKPVQNHFHILGKISFSKTFAASKSSDKQSLNYGLLNGKISHLVTCNSSKYGKYLIFFIIKMCTLKVSTATIFYDLFIRACFISEDHDIWFIAIIYQWISNQKWKRTGK